MKRLSKKYVTVGAALLLCPAFHRAVMAQDSDAVKARYEEFRNQVFKEYADFRKECNDRYADFLKEAWKTFESKEALLPPPVPAPVPPMPYVPVENPEDETPVEITPVHVTPAEPKPQPKPTSPIKEAPVQTPYFDFGFYGLTGKVRLPKTADTRLKDCRPASISEAWKALGTQEMDNAVRDCLEARIRYNLNDWAYLQFLNRLADEFCGDKNSATLLMAYLYCQSGYKMRLGEDNGKLVFLFASDNTIYRRPFFAVDGQIFYPLDPGSRQISIADVKFDGETPLSLIIDSEPLLGTELSDQRVIKSKKYPDMNIASRVPVQLIEFFNTYPTSAIGNNQLSRWAMYANTPLAESTRQIVYPQLREAIAGCSELEAANRLLNWLQTGLVYEYDDIVWGDDRAFFAEETLYYPYADCEDRAILYTRLIRDLLGLDAALVYYPDHIAAAVRFNTDVAGDALKINGQRYVICDPTYIGAPVGKQMPNLDYSKTETITLKKQ